jgi:hypothetical protein
MLPLSNIVWPAPGRTTESWGRFRLTGGPGTCRRRTRGVASSGPIRRFLVGPADKPGLVGVDDALESCRVNILTDDQHRMLAFIAACNESSYNPTASEVMVWRDNPKPIPAEYRTVEDPGFPGSYGGLGLAGPSVFSKMIDTSMRSVNSLMDSLVYRPPSTRRELVKAAETVIGHLIRLRWLEKVSGRGDDSGLRLTDLGRALLRDREREASTDDDVTVVVLGRNDPLSYPLMIGRFSAAGPGLLVDPFLKLEYLHDMVVQTGLTRFLVSGKPGKQQAGVVDSMRAYLASPSIVRPVEVRASTGLHDRYLIADDGGVMTLGTSVNGVGKTTTVMSEMPATASNALRDEYAQLWAEAELVGPPPVEDEQLEDEGDQDDGDEGDQDDGDEGDQEDEGDQGEEDGPEPQD